jgi:hypothetical protein
LRLSPGPSVEGNPPPEAPPMHSRASRPSLRLAHTARLALLLSNQMVELGAALEFLDQTLKSKAK